MNAAIPYRNDWHPSDALPDMDEQEFARWAALIESRTGMSMPAARRSFLVTSVGLRMREAGFHTHEDYYRYLTSGVRGNVEWAALVDRLTVHETHFLRDPRALEFLTQQVFPERMAARAPDDAVHVWSAGCSTGEEAYTLAMVLDRFLHAAGCPQNFGVTGTDISLQSLATARAGLYGQRRARELPDDYLTRYFETVEGGRLRVAQRLRRRVCFAQMNIMDAGRLGSQEADVIYCQNLLIYFDRGRRQAIADGLVHHLRPGGVLVLGAGELVGWQRADMERVRNRWDVLAYRRRDEL